MVHRIVLLLTLFLNWSSPVAAQQRTRVACLDTATTQTAMTVCAGEASKAADRQLQRLVAELHDSLPTLQRAQLDSAQRAWATYAAVQCRLEAEPYEGGSIYPMQVTLCRRRLAERHIADLAPLLCDRGAPPGEPCLAARRYMGAPRPHTRRR